MPGGILFLCAGNSVRSQMAEGIARALAPADVRIASAGSRPAGVHPEAIAVMKEIGIDISGQYSKDISGIPPEGIDTVITLCGEEECPLFPGRVRRIHWGLPDPAAAGGGRQRRLDGFREVRDELRRRIGDFLKEDPAGAGSKGPQGPETLEGGLSGKDVGR